MIKEYKNLFNRSFAHFIFIASQKAFDLIGGDREKDVDEGGIFPTLFTHVFYLSLPKTNELKDYLNEIFLKENIEGKKKDELISYLLFKSGNDFFDLKRLISDVLCFDDEEKPYIDTDKIKKGDPSFASVSRLFGYVDPWFLQKNFRELKKHWKENCDLQKSVLRFLNENFNRNFTEDKVNHGLKRLIEFLLDIGILESEKIDATDESEKKIVSYRWTGKYKRNVEAPLLEDDKKFNESFSKLIKLANDLDDLPESYKSGKFSDHEIVEEGRDGQELSGINLFSIFLDYENIFEKLKESHERISVTTEKTGKARSVIDEQINNVYKKYFDITVNFLNKIFEEQTEIFINENIDSAKYNIKGVFESLPDFISVVTPSAYESAVYGKVDQTKYVLIIRNFEDEGHVAKALSALKSRQDILIINLVHGDKYRTTHPKVYIDKLGRKRKRGTMVKNFVNLEFNDFRQLSDILIKIEKFLV